MNLVKDSFILGEELFFIQCSTDVRLSFVKGSLSLKWIARCSSSGSLAVFHFDNLRASGIRSLLLLLQFRLLASLF
jgi:hypothetical protein